MTTTQDALFMRRALELAASGRGTVSPNPMVGCVIVYEGCIIGEGWHQKYGEAHAEVHAVNSVKNHALLKESTCYVTLEPCSHHGKTPPCADLLIDKEVKRVVIATSDPNPMVGGRGIEKLKKAGVAVETGILKEEANLLNIRFFTFIKKKRPYVILKWAQTSDGFIARKNYDSKWISNEKSRQLVHQWRAAEDAVMVGTNTARYDDPALNVRDWQGNDPVRVVIDKKLQLNKKLKLFDRSQLTLVYNLQVTNSDDNLSYVQLPEEKFLQCLLDDLYQKGIQSILVEGGAFLLNALLREGMWDEARIFEAREVAFGGGIAAPILKERLVESHSIDTDYLKLYKNGSSEFV